MYSINKFVTSCSGGWLTEACCIRGGLAPFLTSRCWVQVVKVVMEFFFCFFFTFPFSVLLILSHFLCWALAPWWWNNAHSHLLQSRRCVTAHVVNWTYERLGGGAASRGQQGNGGMRCSLGGVLRRWSPSLVSAAVLGASLVLEVVVTVLTNAHRWRDLQPFDLRLEATASAKESQVVREGSRREAKSGRKIQIQPVA